MRSRCGITHDMNSKVEIEILYSYINMTMIRVYLPVDVIKSMYFIASIA